jgi:hypothetical protein
MKFFNLFNRKRTVELDQRSAENILKRVANYIPDFYFQQPQYGDCIEFLDNHEWELALNCLIELAEGTGHYFSEEFWTELSQAAKKMNLFEKSTYCLKQVDQNKQNCGSGTPFGWTTIKLDENHFQHHISQRLKNDWAADRRAKDRIYEWLEKDGVYSRGPSRAGCIYYSEKGKMAEVEYELGANAVILYLRLLKNWILPEQITLTNLEKQRIKDAIIEWAKKKDAIDVDDFDPPLEFEASYDYGQTDVTNEQNLTLWKYGELVKTLITLSSESDRQKELVGAGAVAEEMAEDFNRYFTESVKELKGHRLLTDELFIHLQKLDQFLDDRSGDNMPEFWDDSKLESHPDWTIVRHMAGDILSSMKMGHLDVDFDRTEKYETTDTGRQLVVQSTRTRLVNKEADKSRG